MLVGLVLLASPSALAADTGTVATGATDTGTTCQAEGDPCTAEDGSDGECDAELTCISDSEPSGCATTGAGAGWLGIALGGLALRRRHR